MKDISLKFTKLHWVKNAKTLAVCHLSGRRFGGSNSGILPGVELQQKDGSSDAMI